MRLALETYYPEALILNHSLCFTNQEEGYRSWIEDRDENPNVTSSVT